MSITLGALTLPDDLHWSDEFDWTPVVQGTRRTEAGVLVRRESPIVAGRPISLMGDERSAWGDRTLVLALQATQQTANAAPMTLTFHGAAYSVIWSRPPMRVRPVRERISNPDGAELYVIEALNFIQV